MITHGQRMAIEVEMGGRESELSLSLRRLDHLAALVMAAVRAHAMRKLALFTVRALGHAGLREGVMRAALVAAGSGMASFWIRHRDTPRRISCVPAAS